MGRCLEIPAHLACIGIQSYQREGIQVVPGASGLERVGRHRISSGEDVEMSFRIVRSWNPGLGSSMAGSVQVLPRVQSRVTRLHRNGVELSLKSARFRIKGLQ